MVLRLSVALSLVALLVLAGLQYHWIGQIAVAERQRLERGVEESAGDSRGGFFQRVAHPGRNLRTSLLPGRCLTLSRSRRDTTIGRRAPFIPIS